MKKLMGLFLLSLGFLLLSSSSEAAGATRGAKGGYALNYTTTVSTISTSAAVLYQVVMSSGAASEYVALFDASTAGTKAAGTVDSSLKGRLFYSSATANTVISFDPPMQFTKGLIVGPSANTGASLFIWEPGRVPTGY